jgi:hypothetical protein
MAHRPLDPSRPVVCPDCSHTLLISHMSQHDTLHSTTGPKHYTVMTTGQQGLLEHGQRSSIRRGRRTAYGTTGRTEQRTLPPCSWHCRTFPGTTGRPEAVDATVDSARAVVPFEELLAGRIRLRALPEYAAASGYIYHATFLERADASVRCSGF